jgi:hypothetical protein
MNTVGRWFWATVFGDESPIIFLQARDRRPTRVAACEASSRCRRRATRIIGIQSHRDETEGQLCRCGWKARAAVSPLPLIRDFLVVLRRVLRARHAIYRDCVLVKHLFILNKLQITRQSRDASGQRVASCRGDADAYRGERIDEFHATIHFQAAQQIVAMRSIVAETATQRWATVKIVQ